MGSSNLWPLATNRAFLMNFVSILISKTMLVKQCLYPRLILVFYICSGVIPLSFSNAILTFVISFLIAVCQKLVPILLIYIQVSLYWFWYHNAKFMGGMPVFLLGPTLTRSIRINTTPFNTWNYLIPDLQWVLYPTVKLWLFIYIIYGCIISNIQGAQCLWILEIQTFHIFVFLLNLLLLSQTHPFPGLVAILRYSDP